MKNKKLPSLPLALGICLTCPAPLTPVITLLSIFIDTVHSTSSDDAIGWALIILILIGVGLLPVIAGSALLTAFFIDSIIHPSQTKHTYLWLLLSAAIFYIELLILPHIDFLNYNPGLSVLLGIIFTIILALELFSLLSQNSQTQE